MMDKTNINVIDLIVYWK